MSDVAFALRDKLRIHNTHVQTAAGDVVQVNQGVTCVKKGTGAATQVTLPANPQLGDFAFIKDSKGDSASNNITVVPAAGTIDGNANYVLNINYAAVIFHYNGTEWGVVGGQNVGASIARSQLTQESAVPFIVPLTALRKAATISAPLPATDDGTSPGLLNGTYLTSAPSVQTSDVKAGGAATRTARFLFTVPADYVAGQPLSVRLNAGMVTTVADTTATIGVNAVRQAAPTVDINTTVATTINSLTAANKTFVLTPTNVVVGDVLDVKISIVITDAATGTAVIGTLNSVAVLLSIKG